MSTDAPFTPPKKKPNVLWWLGGGFALLIFIFVLQLFGPNPPIVVSPQTTYITTPLGANGLPDYEQYVLEKSREGVTPENNAAVLLWAALWPGELDQKDYAAVVTELGLEKIPSTTESLVRLYDKSTHQAVREWLTKQGVLPIDADAGEQQMMSIGGLDDDLIEKVLDEAMSRPWTSEQIPPLAQWAAANKKPLDMLVEASQRPKCYIPSPTLLNREKESLIQVLLPGVQSIREAGRSLPARAMWHLGEGRVDEAWQDLRAVHRIGRLTAQGQTLVEQLVGIAIDGIARECTLALLDHGRLTPDQARSIQRDLASLPNFAGMAGSLNSMERLIYVDLVVAIAGQDKTEMLRDVGIGEHATILTAVSVDWNVVLKKGNEFYDRFAAALRMPDRTARDQAMAQIEADLRQMENNLREPMRLIAGVINRRQRSELAASVMVSLFLPAIQAATSAEDRANSMLELERLAAALAVYRAEHGAYPENLDALVPGALDKLPVDLDNAKPYIYQRDGAGYLLYSAGENGIDDGGSNEMYRTLKGRPVDEFDAAEAEKNEAQIAAGADDLSIRLPRPKWELPKLPPAATEP